MPTLPATIERDARGGFTLMEMVLALAVIGLIAALGLPFSRPDAGATAVRIKTFEIIAMLRADRNAALRSGKATTVLIDSGGRRVRSTTSPMRVQMPVSMALDIAPASAAGIVFFPDGRSSGGQISVRSGPTAFIVDVNSLTAAVSAFVP